MVSEISLECLGREDQSVMWVKWLGMLRPGRIGQWWWVKWLGMLSLVPRPHLRGEGLTTFNRSLGLLAFCGKLSKCQSQYGKHNLWLQHRKSLGTSAQWHSTFLPCKLVISSQPCIQQVMNPGYSSIIYGSIHSLHAEITLPFTNAEINFISLRSKWQALPRKLWAVPKGWFA